MPHQDHIERFRRQGREVFMVRAAIDFALGTPASPQRTGGRFRIRRRSYGYCQIQSQPFQRPAMIVRLAAAFRGLAFDAGRRMMNVHCRFGFIPMLTARSAPPLMPNAALR